MISVIDIGFVVSFCLESRLDAGGNKMRLRHTRSKDRSGRSMKTVFATSSILGTGRGSSAMGASL